LPALGSLDPGPGVGQRPPGRGAAAPGPGPAARIVCPPDPPGGRTRGGSTLASRGDTGGVAGPCRRRFSMTEGAGTSYDEVTYSNTPFYHTHPDCLATLGTLFGMSPAPPDRCRVLELGCGRGGNLIPMALSLPASRFVGIDLSRG